MKEQRAALQKQLLREYAAGKKIGEIADRYGKNYQWVYQRLQPLPEFRNLRRVRKIRESHWLQKRCPRCGETRLRNEYPRTHRWCKLCRRAYYQEYHRRKKQ